MPSTPIAIKASSNIKSATFDAETGTMDVTFKDATYRYRNVTAKLVAEFEAAKSPGEWFSKAIRDRTEFPMEKLGAPTSTQPAARPEADAEIAKDDLDGKPATVLAVDEHKVSPEIFANAESDYVAYCANANNRNFSGGQCPAWQDLTSAIRSHWCAVAVRESRVRVDAIAELDRVKRELAHVNEATGSVDERRVNAAVKERTQLLEEELNKLRAEHDKLAAEKKNGFAPWRA